MKSYRLTISAATALGTPLLGETLFGSLCWAVVRLFGVERLKELLIGYGEGKPFAVVSDAFPEGYVPLPALPSISWATRAGDDRKYLKKKAWLAVKELLTTPENWQAKALTEAELAATLSLSAAGGNITLKTHTVRVHNTINRSTLTTGEGMFAPYQQTQMRFHPLMQLAIYVLVDETRFSESELQQAMTFIGLSGFGRDASAGLGKFEVIGAPQEMSLQPASRSRLALASVSLGGITGIVAEKTFYRIKTHFGRHGAELALSGAPFKKPVVLAQAGAVMTFDVPQNASFVGQGITGISSVKPETVHQGYCPVLALADLAEVGK